MTAAVMHGPLPRGSNTSVTVADGLPLEAKPLQGAAQTAIPTFFRPSASSKWNPNTNLNKSFKNTYCPLRIIQPTLFATSLAEALLPCGGKLAADLNVGSDNTRFLYEASNAVCHARLPNEPVGIDFTNVCKAGATMALGPLINGEVREKPAFMAALRMRIFRRVRLWSSDPVVVVAVLDVLLLPCEKPERTDEALDQRTLEERLLSVPRTRMLGMEGELSSGDMGVSSNSVVGVSGWKKRRRGPVASARRCKVELWCELVWWLEDW